MRTVTFPLTIHYLANVQPTAEKGGPPYGLRAVGGGIAGAGRGFLLLPDSDAVMSLRLHWDLSALPKLSVGVITAGEGDVSITGSPLRFNDQWVLAGPATVLRDNRLRFRAFGLGNPPFDMAQELAWADKVYAVLVRSFTYIRPAPPYILLVRALDGNSFGTGTAFEGGALVSVGSQYFQGQDLSHIHEVLFHEMTHQWVGETREQRSWFSEGLTTYTTAVLRFRAGLSSPAEYADELNRLARQYYGTEAQNWSEGKIGALGLTNDYARRVPYARSAFYFANLDEEIRRRSHGKRDLYAFLNPLMRARQAGKPFSESEWETALTTELGAVAADDFRRVIMDGKRTVIPTPRAFGRCVVPFKTAWRNPEGRTVTDGIQWRTGHTLLKTCRRPDSR